MNGKLIFLHLLPLSPATFLTVFGSSFTASVFGLKKKKEKEVLFMELETLL